MDETTVFWTCVWVVYICEGGLQSHLAYLTCRRSFLGHKMHECSTLQTNSKQFSKVIELIYISLIFIQYLSIYVIDHLFSL